LKNPKADADQVAKPFGYRAPFTGRYKSWLHKTGIVTTTRAMSLTPMGEVVWKQDPNFESIVSQWFMHHQLCEDPERAEAWHFFEHEFLPSRNSFSQEELEMGLAMKLMPHHATHFGKDAPMIKVIARKLAQCYTQECGLGSLGIISSEGGNCYSVANPPKRGPWATELALEEDFKRA
jgi:hypothetical protein